MKYSLKPETAVGRLPWLANGIFYFKRADMLYEPSEKHVSKVSNAISFICALSNIAQSQQ